MSYTDGDDPALDNEVLILNAANNLRKALKEVEISAWVLNDLTEKGKDLYYHYYKMKDILKYIQ